MWFECRGPGGHSVKRAFIRICDLDQVAPDTGFNGRAVVCLYCRHVDSPGQLIEAGLQRSLKDEPGPMLKLVDEQAHPFQPVLGIPLCQTVSD